MDGQPKADRKRRKKVDSEHAVVGVDNGNVESEPHIPQPRPKRLTPAQQAEEKERLRKEESSKLRSMPKYVSL